MQVGKRKCLKKYVCVYLLEKSNLELLKLLHDNILEVINTLIHISLEDRWNFR